MTDFVGDAPIRLSGPTGLLAAVPSMMGFHPTNSIVLMCLAGATHELGPIARVDLPRGRDAALARQLTVTALNHADHVALVCYPRTRRRPPVLDDVIEQLDACDIGVMTALVVHAGRAWPALIRRPLRLADSLPVPGPDDPGVQAMAAATALEGRVVLADRDQLRASIAGPRGRRRLLAERAVRAAAGRLAAGPCGDPAEDAGPAPTTDTVVPGIAPVPAYVGRTIDRALAEVIRTGTVDVRLAAELAVACCDRDVRDSVVVRGLLELDRTWLPMLISCAAWTPDYLAAGICAVLGTIAYRHGDGALGQVAVDRCFRAEPGHRLAGLLVATMAAGMPPQVLDGLLVPDDESVVERPADHDDDSAVA